ncbi:MAG: ATP synthase F1 subunit epsilon [Clostridium sp.]|jgi:F-type H+-transporting ATPase subunit epsilon|nr:ATP synthase F1 subunit epsilon [Clostridium sp.]
MAKEQGLFLRVITPERVFYEGAVLMVELNTTEGEIGVLPDHIPLTVILQPGVLKIHEEGQDKEAALHAGFAKIVQDSITILAERVEWPHEIDEKRALAAMERAQERLRSKTPETDVARAQTALSRALARIAVIKS